MSPMAMFPYCFHWMMMQGILEPFTINCAVRETQLASVSEPDEEGNTLLFPS